MQHCQEDKEGECPIDFHQWFSEACSECIGMNPRIHKNCTMAPAILVVALLLSLQTQIRGKVESCKNGLLLKS